LDYPTRVTANQIIAIVIFDIYLAATFSRVILSDYSEQIK